MIKRIVKMSFKPEEVATFEEVFRATRDRIAGFEGCRNLELHKEKNAPNIYFTVSHWESEEALNKYRNSELFAATWAKTKVLFNAKPEAWSLVITDL
ncbi:MAG: antibiotic biosynthesis monooxygenase [Bacteroidia bacterium]|nr:antibiotic biosynthesis monooxygenase [Bacteroidia bacterium]